MIITIYPFYPRCILIFNILLIHNLKYMRQFYQIFEKGHALRGQLSWTHYRLLLKVDNENAREFYIEQAIVWKVLSVAVYWFLIRPFNVLQIVAGMKKNLFRFQDKYFETKGYRIHAAQMLKTLSSKVKKAKVPASAYDT